MRLVFTVTLILSLLLPVFVVISITPLPALDPYNAAALGPLSTEIDSTSFGLMSVIPPEVTWHYKHFLQNSHRQR